MPNIHGLPALLTLIFAPWFEFRADEKSKRYTGAICGLGVGDKVSAGRDMEIEFDTKIDDQVSHI